MTKTHNARRGRLRLFAGVVLTLALVATACGDDDDDTASGATGASASSTAAGATSTSAGGAASATTAAAPGCQATAAGTQLNIGQVIPIRALDPVQGFASYYGGSESAALFDVLMRYDFDKGAYVPQAAESMTPNADFTQWTLKLRPNMKFSNGDAFDVDNLFASLDRYIGQSVRNNAATYLKYIKTREKIDPATARFTLIQPWATFPYVFATSPGMVMDTKAIGSDLGAFAANPSADSGIGPYVLEKFTPGDELILKARSNYWGGPVCVERLRFKFVPGAQATYDAYKNGDLNVAFIREDNVVKQAEADGQPSLTELQDASQIQLLNVRAGQPGADPKVRQAVAMATDLNVTNERVYNNSLLVSRSFIHPDSAWYSDAIKEMPAVDTNKAKQLVTEAKAAGWDGGLVFAAGNTPPQPDWAITAVAQLTAVGIDASSQVGDAQETSVHVTQGDFEMAQWGFAIGRADAPIALAQNLRSDSPSNRAGYKSPQMDAALDELLAASTDDQIKTGIAKVNNILVVDLPAINVGAARFGLIHKPAVKGIKQTQSIVYLFDKASIT